MYIKDLDKDYIEKKMNQSGNSTKHVMSYSSFVLGWRAALRFAQKVEDADYMCIQCGKLLNAETDEVRLDAGCEPFCVKCYKKVFGQ